MGVVEQSVVERCEDGDKEKKKKRRSRRSKQNASASGLILHLLVLPVSNSCVRVHPNRVPIQLRVGYVG